MTTAGTALVVGLGNLDRGDDAAGLEAVRLLAARVPPGTRVYALAGGALDLLDCWTGAPLVIVIDAMVSGAAPGTVRRVDGRAAPLWLRTPPRSTHAVGLAEVIELGRILRRLPERLIVLGIEARDWTRGARISPTVQRGVRKAVRMARRILVRGARGTGPHAGGGADPARPATRSARRSCC